MDLSHVEAMFFTAMQAGYAVEGVSKAQVTDMPGHKEIRYEEKPDFLFVDRWCVNPDSEKSAGTTTIWYQSKPVWFMSYGGVYPQAYIPFLKLALRRQYCEDGHFNGGRGPATLVDQASGLIYMNRPKLNEFSQFRGREELFGIPRGGCVAELAGYHEYWGMSLI
ncbi:MAG: hypothetical protein A3G05_00945 [Candidatus Zambryskibacteria bacterium RIFCSPLOWO2_12_FULL_45_14]|uniref:DUF5680 domain-containing protein n=2 Tax=Candidatus Zambryskiibacteriota TaxID=1817925 RepID=A0A1G2UMU0_9BACT|nr:MAG: hypothetical protein A3H60_00890 [Candidatus Zambryskibacteria bacterium RIFCSPLOWO2_02_FULL_44_12b]OHB13632.1 MAG: hypothetical protein A3G05_00945 [Candidatus Zambryskibacteria bacterium RIFCSPLOWO2_12_FULL_45_14]